MAASYDVIVIGAGPGGSSAARALAEQGVKTLLLDRARFPRDKPCGGGVNLRAARLLPFSLKPVTEQVVSSVRFSFRMGRPFRYSYPQPLTFMTQRSRLDTFLVEQAIVGGAQFRDGCPVRDINLDGKAVTVRTERDAYQARVIIGADGANGIVARAVGLGGHRMAVAYEGNVPYSTELAERWRGIIGLDLGALSGGYGWLFPKGDHVNVGVGGWQAAVGPRLRAHLSALCSYYHLPEDQLFGRRGYRLPLRRPGAPIVQGPVLLVGDAAGLIDPLSGEGIYGAVYSATIAVPHVVAYVQGMVPDLTGYQCDIERLLVPELAASRQLQLVFHHMPAPFVALLRANPLFWRALCRIIRGELTYNGFLSRLGPFRRLLDCWAAYAGQRLVGIADR